MSKPKATKPIDRFANVADADVVTFYGDFASCPVD